MSSGSHRVVAVGYSCSLSTSGLQLPLVSQDSLGTHMDDGSHPFDGSQSIVGLHSSYRFLRYYGSLVPHGVLIMGGSHTLLAFHTKTGS